MNISETNIKDLPLFSRKAFIKRRNKLAFRRFVKKI